MKACQKSTLLFTLLLILANLPGERAAVSYCKLETSLIYHKPQLRVLYAIDETYCIDASAQKGTVLAIVECSAYGTAPSFAITQNPQQIFDYHTSTYTNGSDGAHVDLVHLTLNSNSAYLQQVDVIDMGCILTSDCSVVVNATIRFNFCTKPKDPARPYFLTIPQKWTLQLPLSHPTGQYPLFSAFAKILDIPIVLTTIPSFHLKFLQVHRPFNESAEFSSHLKTIEIPFYISDDFLYFNASKANEIGVDDKYHVIITANGTEPGRVGMVLTTVSVERVNKTQDTNLRHQAPSATVLDFDLSSASCPYAESQPGQLLAVIKCSDPGDPTGASLNASILIVLKEEVIQFGRRTILVPSSDADIVVRRDHNSPSHFYLLLEHVNFVPPETTQEVAPTYEAYVQCTNGASMATPPVTFCIKHSKLGTRLTESISFSYTPATLYFTNIPREFHIFTNPPATHRQHFFNVRVGVWNAKVPSYSISTKDGVYSFSEADYILKVWDTEFQVHSVSGESPNFEIYTILTVDLEYPKVCFILLVSENRSNLSFPAAYDLMITLGPRNYKIADKAAMVTTVFLHEGTGRDGGDNLTDNGQLFDLQNVIPGDFNLRDQVIHSAAPAGTLLAVFKCSGRITEPNITVMRTQTLTSDVTSENSISFDIAKDHSKSDINYLLVNRITTLAHQYYLVSCSDGYSVSSERIAFHTVGTLQTNIQPYFSSVKPEYRVSVVDIDGDDVQVFGVEAVLPGVVLQNVTYEMETQLSLDLPFYMSNSQVMLNVSKVQETGLNTSYDVIISATAALESRSALLRETLSLTRGRVHTVIHVDTSDTTLKATTDMQLQVDKSELTISLSVTIPILCIGGVVVVMATCLVKRRMQKKKHIKVYWMTRSSKGFMKIQVDPEWKTEWRHVKLGEVLGKGQFGEVHRGMITWQGVPAARRKQYDQNSLIPVAIKMMKESQALLHNDSTDAEKAFSEELALMVKVSTGQNPHIVKLIGCITDQSPAAVLLELAPYGDLCSYLRTLRKTANSFKIENEVPTVDLYESLSPLESSDLTSFTQQIASGMEYLAALGVIHRDLACRNVLVGEGKVLKIADFGLSRDTDLYVSTLSTKLPIRWMAPESIQDRLFSEKSDVWSYGVTIWEICTFGGVPYADLSNKVVVKSVLAGYHLERPANCSDEIYEIMEDCWKQDPEDRSTFSEVHQTLHTLIDAENSENYISITVGMDLSPTEHVQMEDEWSDQLQTTEDEAGLADTGVFTENSCVVVEVH